MYEGRKEDEEEGWRDRRGFEGGENSEFIGSGAEGLAGLAGFQQEGHGCGAASRAKGLVF